MSQTATADTTVELFGENMPHTERADESRLYGDKIDGKAWVSNAKVFLLTPEVTEYGIVEFDEYTDAEYIKTDSEGDHRVYTFTAGEHTHAVDVDIVRRLANDVFDVSYSEIRSWAKTINTEDRDMGMFENDAPVMFDVPNSEYRIVVAPVVYGE